MSLYAAPVRRGWLAAGAMLCALAPTLAGQAQRTQPIDSAYTAQIKALLTDPRISTELVDHLPASATVPTPLAFHGRIVGQPGEVTYAKDIHRYLEAVAQASGGRAKVWSIGKTEEGRDLIVMAIADEATIRDLDRYRGMLHQLTDPRVTTEAQAQALLKTAKPIYWVTSGLHSPERGGPEMLMEMAYRMVVDDGEMMRRIRGNVITFITPVLEVDGREKMVDTYYYNKKFGQDGNLTMVYWGKYVAHDNNRDGMGQFLALTRHTTRTFLEWKPTVLHDLHEAQTYLYSSTGSGPYNEALDPIVVDEWWLLAKTDVLEMTKRGVPGVWTYGFYDGWTPNYLFFVAHSHNAIGRFYEVASYGPENRVVTAGGAGSREWFRPNPPLPRINWGPRANVNIQQSALLFSIDRVARDRELFLENYWLKNKRAIARGTQGPIRGWVVPAASGAPVNTAEAINDLRTQGLEIHRATAAFTVEGRRVEIGDFIIRGDQPYRTLGDMYFSLQNFSPTNPSPYDDTGWTFPLMRNMTMYTIGDSTLLTRPMALVTANVLPAGGIAGTGNVVIVPHVGDNALATFRFRFPQVRMLAAEEAFEVDGRRFGAGAFIIPQANRGALSPVLASLGLSAVAVARMPTVRTHPLTVPRIGYIHSWGSTQDEGWVRAALDHYGIPYHYFGEPKVREGTLRDRYDVIIYPHGGSGVTGGATIADKPVPYRRTAEFQAIGYPDSTDDIRGGLGQEGARALYEFVQQGGTLIMEGGTAPLFPSLGLVPGVRQETVQGLFSRGSVLRGVIADQRSPLVYGYAHTELPVYFKGSPILNIHDQPAVTPTSTTVPSAQNITPMANRLQLSGWDPDRSGVAYAAIAGDTVTAAGGGPGRGAAGPGRGAGAAGPGRGAGAAGPGRGAAGAGPGRGGPGRGGPGAGATLPGVTADPAVSVRAVIRFPESGSDMLLSGTLSGGDVLAGRGQLVDARIGRGHLVMFAIRPFWRWQTQGTYNLGFNAIIHWDQLQAGQP